MMTIRFENGCAIQYNSANWANRTQWGYTDIYTKKDGIWIAQVPNSCVIEAEPACRVYNALVGEPELRRDIRVIKLDVKAIKKKQISANERKK